MRAWSWIVVSGAVAACNLPRIERSYQRIELPGFSLEAPTFVKAKPGLSYREGDVEAREGLSSISISWKVGKPFSVQELPATVKTVLEELAEGEKVTLERARSQLIGGQKASVVSGTVGMAHTAFADITCGGRSVMISVAGLAIDELRDRIFGSFQCKPSAAEEKQLADTVPIGVDDPTTLASLRYVDDDRSSFVITNGDQVAVFDTTTGDTQEIDMLRGLMPKLLGAGANFKGDPKGRESRGRRTFDRGTMTLEDGTTRAAVTSLWRCDNDADAVLALVLVPDKADQPKAIDWLMKIRCAKPGDPPLPIGPPPAGSDAPEPANPTGPTKSKSPVK